MKLLSLLTLLTASPVLADCPVAADLATGVRVTETDGTVNLFTAIGDGVVQNDGTAGGGYTYRNVLAQGTHLVELGDTEQGDYIPDTLRRISYPQTRENMPIPQANSRSEYPTSITSASGSYSEHQTQTWGTLTTLVIGDCTYDMIPGKLVYTNSDYTVFEGLHYLPALELALLHRFQIQGDPASDYIAARIEAVE